MFLFFLFKSDDLSAAVLRLSRLAGVYLSKLQKIGLQLADQQRLKASVS